MTGLIPRAIIDFETRSAAPLGQKAGVGAWKYSKHPTTQVLCLSFRLPYWEDGRVETWHPAFPTLGIPEAERGTALQELLDWIDEGGLVEAHNVGFEQVIWQNVLMPKHGFPPVKPEQWRCSAAKAASHSLPRNLAEASHAVSLKIVKRLLGAAAPDAPPIKDLEGKAVMRKMAKPRKPKKAEVELMARHKLKPQLLWHESKALHKRLQEYNRQDVTAEEGFSSTLPDLNELETQVFALDSVINNRGFKLDREAVDIALTLIAHEEKLLNGELAVLSGGMVKKATQRVRFLKWLDEAQNVRLPDTKAETIDAELEEYGTTHNPTVLRALQILQQLGKSSTAKYQKMRDWMDDDDDRARGGLLYHGASTGRWSGKGIQPHNFVRGNVADIDGLWTVIKTGDRAAIAAFPDKDGTPLGSVMEALAQALRGAIIPSVGHQLFVADYAGIEARVLLWVAQDEDGLDIFRDGRDIYCEMASEIYGRTVTKKDKAERAIGKVAILGLGYQMGWSKFKDTAAKSGNLLTDAEAQSIVDAYRKKFWRTKQTWYDQESAACRAVKFPNKKVRQGVVSWLFDEPSGFLYCILPSGRRLAYPDPEVEQKSTPWGEMKDALTFMGVHPLKHKWMRQTTYGGMLVENIVQAIARDLMAEAMLRIERTGDYFVTLTVHDEIIAEGTGNDVAGFEELMAELPDWAVGCPVAVEGWAGPRYRK